MELEAIKIDPGKYAISIRTGTGKEQRFSIGHACRLEDGYFAFMFSEKFPTDGFWTNEFFGLINNKLRDLNQEWDQQVREELGTEN